MEIYFIKKDVSNSTTRTKEIRIERKDHARARGKNDMYCIGWPKLCVIVKTCTIF
jgi:hypothetical protein